MPRAEGWRVRGRRSTTPPTIAARAKSIGSNPPFAFPSRPGTISMVLGSGTSIGRLKIASWIVKLSAPVAVDSPSRRTPCTRRRASVASSGCRGRAIAD